MEQTGFIDVERSITNSSRSTFDLANLVDAQSKIKFEARQNYYIWAQQKADEAKFHQPLDKKIWKEYAQGSTFRDIGGKVGLDHGWIWHKVKKIENYLKEQAEMIVSSTTYSQAVYR